MKRNLNTASTLATMALVALVGLGLGCKPKPKSAPEAQPTPTPESMATPTVVRVEPTPAPQPTPRTSDVLAGSVDALNRGGYLDDVYYDFDKADIRADARDALTKDANWLKRYPSVQITIEGYADERGTAQYNLALGDRRANAAKDYLTSLGVDGGRVRTISYGKERPFCQGHDESCWQKNRVGHFLITAK